MEIPKLEGGVRKIGIPTVLDRFIQQAVMQGGPLSPLLSNIVLDELDRELQRRKHRFVQYADDCNIYVGSRRAGQRVMNSITGFLSRQWKLKVNEAKSAVARPETRKFLGFSFSLNKEPKALLRCKQTIWELTRRT